MRVAVDQAMGKREKQADRCVNQARETETTFFESRIWVKRCVVGTVKELKRLGRIEG